MKKIYLATPYTGNEEHNFIESAKKASELMNEGHFVFCPITHSHPIAVYGNLPGHWDFWEKYDREWLNWCEEIWVYRLPGWDKSKGVDREIKIAVEMKKKVVYI